MSVRTITSVLCALTILLVKINAQCSSVWLPAPGPTPAFNGEVMAVLPLSNNRMIVGGYFTLPFPHLAYWNGAVWSPLGSGPGGSVDCLALRPNGHVVAGGAMPGGVVVWDGMAWSLLGNGISGPFVPRVACMVQHSNGDLIVGGQFTAAGGWTADNVARWDGATWRAMGFGLTGGFSTPVQGLVELPQGIPFHLGTPGDVIATGAFISTGGNPVYRVARWSGASWQSVGTGFTTGTQPYVRNPVVRPDGELVVAHVFIPGAIFSFDSQPNRWTTFGWQAIGPVLPGQVRTMITLADGDLVAGGLLTGTLSGAAVVRFDGTNWAPIGSLSVNGSVNVVMRLSNDDVAVGGSFSSVGGAQGPNLARLSTTCPATTFESVQNCVGTGGPNTLVALSLPWTGGHFRARAYGLHNSSLVVAVYGFSLYQPAIPLNTVFPTGVAGCSILMPPDISGLFLPQLGQLTTDIMVGDSPGLVGLTFFHYVVSFEVDSLLHFLAVTSTNYVSGTIGTF